MQTKLSIAIPTYNRAEILKDNLSQIVDELILHQIPVYISDDSPNEDTKIVIEELSKKHSLFYYHKNTPSLGHDRNCFHTIGLSKEDYVWYLGDSMIIKSGAIQNILEVLSVKDYDFISCNGEGRELNIPSKEFTNKDDLIESLGWHLTMSGATIYNTKNVLDLRFEIEKFKNFPQLALIFVKFGLSKSSLYWINDKLISGNKNKKSYWSNGVFDVFLTDFINFSKNLPDSYSDKAKENLVLQHSIKTGVFSYHSFVLYRINNVLNLKSFSKFKTDFSKYTNVNLFVLKLIAIMPIIVLRPVYKLVYVFSKLF